MYNEYATDQEEGCSIVSLPSYVELVGKRVAAFDYGLKRIGFAVCDELHITVTPRAVIQNDSRLWENVFDMLQRYKVEAVVIGVPYRHDNTSSPMIEATQEFAQDFESRISLPVYLYDEAFSSRKAAALMMAGGMPKKKRRQKGATDRVAAAVILREFLDETSNQIYRY